MARRTITKLHLAKETLRIMRSTDLAMVAAGGPGIGGVIAASGKIAGCTINSQVVDCTVNGQTHDGMCVNQTLPH